MKEHPQFDVLLNPSCSWPLEVKKHVGECSVCTQIVSDAEIFDLELKELQGDVLIPAEQDGKIRAHISERSKQIKGVLFWRRLVLRSGSVAAALLIGFVMFFDAEKSVSEQKTLARESSSVIGDFNNDGKLDVLDSFQFAKALEAGEELDSRYDMNEDGTIDGEDLGDLRRQVVNVESAE